MSFSPPKRQRRTLRIRRCLSPYSCFRLAVQLLLQPILTVHIAGHDEGYHIVACGIDHGGGGIHQIADSQRDGVRDGQLVREEDGANHQFAGTASARDTTHGRGEHRHDDSQNSLIRGEVHPEHAEQKCHLDDGGHGRAGVGAW